MIAAGLVRAVARRPLWSLAVGPLAMGPRALGALAIAGVAAAPVFLTAPALAGTAGNLDARAGARAVTSCGAGVSAVNVRLPAGFNPLTATPAQLAANDLPLRPTGLIQLATWRRFVTGGVRAARSTCVFAAVTPSICQAFCCWLEPFVEMDYPPFPIVVAFWTLALAPAVSAIRFA